MSFAVTAIQTLSAFVIFVAGYLLLLALIVGAIVLASGLYGGIQLTRTFMARRARHALSGDGFPQRPALSDESTKVAFR